ncbi:hypothetical protein OG749_39760 [Streptomyces nojiriensis]|uniref:hypothetical protein n=1 Tax=Streptomyces nojiriensis TaxID=66374 RepID=UPI002E196CBD
MNSDGTDATIGGNQDGKATRGKISTSGHYGSQRVSGYVPPVGGRGGDAGGGWAEYGQVAPGA